MKYFYCLLLAVILIFSCMPKPSFAISDDESADDVSDESDDERED